MAKRGTEGHRPGRRAKERDPGTEEPSAEEFARDMAARAERAGVKVEPAAPRTGARERRRTPEVAEVADEKEQEVVAAAPPPPREERPVRRERGGVPVYGTSGERIDPEEVPGFLEKTTKAGEVAFERLSGLRDLLGSEDPSLRHNIGARLVWEDIELTHQRLQQALHALELSPRDRAELEPAVTSQLRKLEKFHFDELSKVVLETLTHGDDVPGDEQKERRGRVLQSNDPHEQREIANTAREQLRATVMSRVPDEEPPYVPVELKERKQEDPMVVWVNNQFATIKARMAELNVPREQYAASPLPKISADATALYTRFIEKLDLAEQGDATSGAGARSEATALYNELRELLNTELNEIDALERAQTPDTPESVEAVATRVTREVGEIDALSHGKGLPPEPPFPPMRPEFINGGSTPPPPPPRPPQSPPPPPPPPRGGPAGGEGGKEPTKGPSIIVEPFVTTSGPRPKEEPEPIDVPYQAKRGASRAVNRIGKLRATIDEINTRVQQSNTGIFKTERNPQVVAHEGEIRDLEKEEVARKEKVKQARETRKDNARLKELREEIAHINKLVKEGRTADFKGIDGPFKKNLDPEVETREKEIHDIEARIHERNNPAHGVEFYETIIGEDREKERMKAAGTGSSTKPAGTGTAEPPTRKAESALGQAHRRLKEALANAASTPEEIHQAREARNWAAAQNAGMTDAGTKLREAEEQVMTKEMANARRGLLQRLLNRNKPTAEIGQMNEAGAEYERALEKRMAAKFEAKRDRLAPGLANREFQKRVAERYRRSVIHPEIIAAGEKARASAVNEAKRSREQGKLEQASRHLLSRAATLNAEMEKTLGKNGARAARVFVSALVGGVIAAPLGIAAAGAVTLRRLGVASAGVYGGAAAGLAAGGAYEKTLGKAAGEKLAASKIAVAKTAADIEAKRKAYREGTPEAIERKRKQVEMLTAALVGGTVSLAAFAYPAEAAVPPNVTGAPTVPVDVERLAPEPPLIRAPAGPDRIRPADPYAPEPAEPAPTRVAPVPPAEPPPPAPAPPPPEQAPVRPERSPVTAPPPPRPTVESTPMRATIHQEISVEAGAGEGYENMVRNAVEQLRASGANQNMYPVGSDAHRLLMAEQKGKLNAEILKIEKEVHGFLKPDGSSVIIGQDAKITIGQDGQIIFTDENHPEGTANAPADAATAPPPTPPKAPAAPRAEAVPKAPAVVAPRAPTASDALNQQEFARSQAAPRGGAINRLTPAGSGSSAPPPPGPEGLPRPPGSTVMSAEFPKEPFVNVNNIPVDPTRGGIYDGAPGAPPIAYANDFRAAELAARDYIRQTGAPVVYIQSPEPAVVDGVSYPYVLEMRQHRLFGPRLHGHVRPGVMPPREQLGRVDPRTFRARRG